MIAISTRPLASLFDWEKDPGSISQILEEWILKEIQFHSWITVTVVLLARGAVAQEV